MSSKPKPQHRVQHTIRRAVEVSGIGFFTGADATVRFLPAEPDYGIAFQRTDRPGSSAIPALLEYTVPRKRRTAIAHQGVVVEMTEHVLAALAGLQIDNCLIQLNAPEPPGCDGSALLFVEALLDAGIDEQHQARDVLVVETRVKATGEDKTSEISAEPSTRRSLVIRYQLDYPDYSLIPPQNLTVEITPDSFVNELAFARTFILETEVDALRAQGYGCRTTANDLLVFGSAGIIDNQLRAYNECARHKILDCLGDFALLGCDILGNFNAYRSGHRLNREIVRRLWTTHRQDCDSSGRCAA